ncbi:MAG: LPS export ABC transporter periplasmic protein LptC [Candidatus Omnitrophica bacterium]|nr:LPS export ABC transporter periplasmic protein LptC [Candidatus Omnitrophota bacterium]
MKIILFILILNYLSATSFALEEKLNSFTLTGYDQKNNKRWEMEGENADLNGDDILLNSIKAKLYEEKGPVNIKADKGFLNRSEKLVHLEDNVIIENHEGDKLYAEVLNWDQDNERVWTDLPIRIVKDENEITGVGGELDTKMSKAVVKKDVKFQAIPQTIVKSDGPLQIDYTNNVAVFEDNVHVVDRRGELFCDKLTVYFDQERKEVTKAHALGNVRLKRGNSCSYSEEAVYDMTAGIINLLGNPKLEIYPKD